MKPQTLTPSECDLTFMALYSSAQKSPRSHTTGLHLVYGILWVFLTYMIVNKEVNVCGIFELNLEGKQERNND